MAKLVVRSGPAEPKSLPLGKAAKIVIGRADQSDIVIASDRVSRRHVQVTSHQGQIQVEDLGSRNGTLLDGKPVTAAAAWTSGQVLSVGPCEFALESDISDQETVVTRPEAAARSAASGSHAAPEPAKAATASGNFFTRHWRGEYGLARTIFVNVLLILFGLLLFSANFFPLLLADASPGLRRIYFSIEILILLAAIIWMITGLVRSLLKAKARGSWLITRIWGWLNVPSLVLFAGLLVIGWIAGLSGIRDSERGTDSSGQPVYRLTISNQVLIFEGQVVWPIVADFQRTLSANPNITTILLQSPGGDVVAGRRVYDIIKQRGLTTAVTQDCHSACTIMLAGGPRRLATQQAQIGFHATSIIQMDEMMTRIMNGFTMIHDDLNANYYLEAGFDPQFVQRAVNTPSTDLWIPTTQQLLDAGVITEIIPPDQ